MNMTGKIILIVTILILSDVSSEILGNNVKKRLKEIKNTFTNVGKEAKKKVEKVENKIKNLEVGKNFVKEIKKDEKKFERNIKKVNKNALAKKAKKILKKAEDKVKKLNEDEKLKNTLKGAKSEIKNEAINVGRKLKDLEEKTVKVIKDEQNKNEQEEEKIQKKIEKSKSKIRCHNNAQDGKENNKGDIPSCPDISMRIKAQKYKFLTDCKCDPDSEYVTGRAFSEDPEIESSDEEDSSKKEEKSYVIFCPATSFTVNTNQTFNSTISLSKASRPEALYTILLFTENEEGDDEQDEDNDEMEPKRKFLKCPEDDMLVSDDLTSVVIDNNVKKASEYIYVDDDDGLDSEYTEQEDSTRQKNKSFASPLVTYVVIGVMGFVIVLQFLIIMNKSSSGNNNSMHQGKSRNSQHEQSRIGRVSMNTI